MHEHRQTMHWARLPIEIKRYILEFLEIEELINLGIINKEFEILKRDILISSTLSTARQWQFNFLNSSFTYDYSIDPYLALDTKAKIIIYFNRPNINYQLRLKLIDYFYLKNKIKIKQEHAFLSFISVVHKFGFNAGVFFLKWATLASQSWKIGYFKSLIVDRIIACQGNRISNHLISNIVANFNLKDCRHLLSKSKDQELYFRVLRCITSRDDLLPNIHIPNLYNIFINYLDESNFSLAFNYELIKTISVYCQYFPQQCQDKLAVKLVNSYLLSHPHVSLCCILTLRENLARFSLRVQEQIISNMIIVATGNSKQTRQAARLTLQNYYYNLQDIEFADCITEIIKNLKSKFDVDVFYGLERVVYMLDRCDLVTAKKMFSIIKLHCYSNDKDIKKYAKVALSWFASLEYSYFKNRLGLIVRLCTADFEQYPDEPDLVCNLVAYFKKQHLYECFEYAKFLIYETPAMIGSSYIDILLPIMPWLDQEYVQNKFIELFHCYSNTGLSDEFAEVFLPILDKLSKNHIEMLFSQLFDVFENRVSRRVECPMTARVISGLLDILEPEKRDRFLIKLCRYIESPFKFKVFVGLDLLYSIICNLNHKEQQFLIQSLLKLSETRNIRILRKIIKILNHYLTEQSKDSYRDIAIKFPKLIFRRDYSSIREPYELDFVSKLLPYIDSKRLVPKLS